MGALAPLGFQRGFFRTEISQSGNEVMLDVQELMNMTDVCQHRCPPPPPPPPPRAASVASLVHSVHALLKGGKVLHMHAWACAPTTNGALQAAELFF